MNIQPWVNHDFYKVQTPSSAKFPSRFLEVQKFECCCKAKDGSLLPRDVLACLTAFGAARRKGKGVNTFDSQTRSDYVDIEFIAMNYTLWYENVI